MKNGTFIGNQLQLLHKKTICEDVNDQNSNCCKWSGEECAEFPVPCDRIVAQEDCSDESLECKRGFGGCTSADCGEAVRYPTSEDDRRNVSDSAISLVSSIPEHKGWNVRRS